MDGRASSAQGHPWRNRRVIEEAKSKNGTETLKRCAPECPPRCAWRAGSRCRAYRSSGGDDEVVRWRGQCPFLVFQEMP